MLCPGGGAPADGHGALAVLGGFGLGFGFGVAVTGLGVGFGVTRGVGAGVTRGVGAGVMAGVGAAVPPGLAMGDPVAAGAADAGTAVGDGLGDTDGLASIDGDGLTDGGGSEADPPGDAVGPDVSDAVVDWGAGWLGGTAAIGPFARADDAACCWSSTPPMPSAIVASTRFRTPRPSINRTRWVAVTAMRDS